MRNETTSREDSTPELTPSAPWRVVAVRTLPDYRLYVTFIDGVAGEVDVSALILAPSAGVFTPLRDAALFARAFVQDGVVTWPGDLDLAPDAMHDEILANGSWKIAPIRS